MFVWVDECFKQFKRLNTTFQSVKLWTTLKIVKEHNSNASSGLNNPHVWSRHIKAAFIYLFLCLVVFRCEYVQCVTKKLKVRTCTSPSLQMNFGF